MQSEAHCAFISKCSLEVCALVKHSVFAFRLMICSRTRRLAQSSNF